MRNRVFLLTTILALGAVLGWAGTTGQLNGTVVDDGGQPLPGAQVTIASDSLIGGERTVVTGGTGNFLFPALMPGEYTVTVVMDSFVTREVKGVRVILDEMTRLSFEMSAASFAGEVVVSGETPVINVTKTALGQAYSEEFLQGSAIGSANRNFTNAIAKTAGIFQPAGLDAYLGDLEVFGSTGNENAYYIDGLSNNEPVTNTFNSRINFDAIDEVNVQTGGYDAEFGFAAGGVFNLVTKSGGNRFSGSLDGRYVGDGFTSSSDAFPSDESLYTYQNLAATIGGPVATDRLWFFASFETYAQERRPVGVEQTNEEDRVTGLLKLTWQLGEAWRLVGKVNYDDWTNKNAIALDWVRPEADASDERTFTTYQVEALGSLSDSLFLNLQVGKIDNTIALGPASGDRETISHIDLLAIVYYINYPDVQLADDGREQIRGDLSWFVDDFGGAHQLKLGVDMSQVYFEFDRYAPGGFIYGDFAGFPYILIEPTPTSGRYEGDYRTAFLQDTWRPHGNVTLNLGVRYDQAVYNTAGQSGDIADMDQIQPRVGLAWDATGDGKTVVRGFWGEFMHPASLTLPALMDTAGSKTYLECTVAGFPDTATCAALAPVFGLPYIDDPQYYPGTGWVLIDEGGSGAPQVEPGLQGPKVEQWTLGIEREIFRNSSLSLSYMYKKTDRFFDNTCNGNIPEPTLGGDCSYFIMTNNVPAEREYKGWVLTFETRAFKNLSLLASYVNSDSEGSYGYTQGANTDFDVYDVHFINRYGFLSNHRKHQFKFNGFWLLPYRFNLGFDLSWRSEMPYTPTDGIITNGNGELFTEPRGSGEGDAYYQIDLQLSKGFALGGSWDLELILSVLNATNAENGIVVCQSIYGCQSGGTQVELGTNTDWQLPRRLELGVRLTF